MYPLRKYKPKSNKMCDMVYMWGKKSILSKLLVLLVIFLALLPMAIERFCPIKIATATRVYPRATPAKIPMKIIQTTHVPLSSIPPHITDSLQGAERTVFNDEEMENYLKTNFPDVMKAFYLLKKPAHRCDLFRYCYLYREGGIYLDIKTYPYKIPVEKLFGSRAPYEWVTCVMGEKKIYNAIIATPPNNPVMLDMIQFIVAFAEKFQGYSRNYHIFLVHMYKVIEEMYGCDIKRPGVTHDGKGRTLRMLEERVKGSEECTKPVPRKKDRYGICSNVYNEHGDIVIIGRDPSYPWKK